MTILSDYYGTPLMTRVAATCQNGNSATGFFHLGSEVVCYGRCSSGVAEDFAGSAEHDASKAMQITASEIRLPFDIAEVIDNLRKERYMTRLTPKRKGITRHALIREAYYLVRELLPVWFRQHLQRAYHKDWQQVPFPAWPVDFTVDSLHKTLLGLTMSAQGCDKVPFIWFWPDGASACLVLTHDVEAEAGRDFTSSLMDIDQSHGFRASFQVVPEKRYTVSDSYVDEIRSRGFEFNIHDLNHDGHLFEERQEFLRRAKKINEYAQKYAARGFRAGAMYRNLDWYDAFEFSYDMSVPNVAHLEPQRGGCCTVMPYFVGKILELPLTTIQDYALFHLLNDYTIDLWKKQVDLVRRRNGLLSFIAHPDYLINRRSRLVYESLLSYLRGVIQQHAIWETIPGEVDRWWRARSQMRLVEDGNGYRIQGPGSERACIAYATLESGQLVYSIDKNPSNQSQPS